MSKKEERPAAPTLPGIPAVVGGPTFTPQIARNCMEFLRRVEVKGLEAFALCEAYAALQVLANEAPNS